MARTVAIGYVSGGGWKESFGRSLLKLAFYDRDQRDVLDGFGFNNGLYVDANRSSLTRTFLTSSCEWLFSLDTDIQFEPDVLYRLLDTATATKALIVSALYIGRIKMKDGTERQCPIWFNKKPNGYFQTVRELRNAPQELDAIGMGCCLIHRSVFEAFPNQDRYRAWFECEDRRIDGKWEFFGEDMVFCDRARALGFTILGDSSIQVDHDKGQLLNVGTMIEEIQREASKAAPAAVTYDFVNGA